MNMESGKAGRGSVKAMIIKKIATVFRGLLSPALVMFSTLMFLYGLKLIHEGLPWVAVGLLGWAVYVSDGVKTEMEKLNAEEVAKAKLDALRGEVEKGWKTIVTVPRQFH